MPLAVGSNWPNMPGTYVLSARRGNGSLGACAPIAGPGGKKSCTTFLRSGRTESGPQRSPQNQLVRKTPGTHWYAPERQKSHTTFLPRKGNSPRRLALVQKRRYHRSSPIACKPLHCPREQTRSSTDRDRPGQTLWRTTEHDPEPASGQSRPHLLSLSSSKLLHSKPCRQMAEGSEAEPSPVSVRLPSFFAGLWS